MSDPTQHSHRTVNLKTRDRVAVLIKIFLLLGIIFAFTVAASYLELIEKPQNINITYLFITIIAQAGNWLVTAWTWQVTVRSIGGIHLSLRECLAQVIMVLVGKYVPGKIWGMAIRAQSLETHGVSYSRCIQATYLEQILFAHTGIFTGLIALTVANNEFLLLFPVALALLASLFLVPQYHDQFLGHLVGFLRRYIFKDKNLNLRMGVSPWEYVKLSSVYLLDWFMWGIILLCLYLTLFDTSLNLEMCALLLGANAIAVVIGFFAFFAPGGIGVREGVAVAILSTQMPATDALLLMIVYRLWLITMEAVGGIVVFLKKNN